MKENKYFKKINGENIHDFFHRNTALSKDNSLILGDNIQYAWRNQDYIKRFSNNIVDTKFDVILPPPDTSLINGKELIHILENRDSSREFQGTSINIEEFSTFAYYSLGVINMKKDSKGEDIFKYMYPSAGALNPLRFIFIIQNIKGLNNGVYMYIPHLHALKIIKKEFLNEEYQNITESFPFASNCNFSVHIFASMEITGFKYGNRGYQFCNLEAGHSMQNMYLIAEAMDYGIVASGGFLDGEINDYLKLKGLYLLYEAFVGKDGRDL